MHWKDLVSPTEARYVTEVIDIAAPPHQVHQTGFAQSARRSLYSGRMGAGRRSDDALVQFHMRSIKLTIESPGCKINNGLQGTGLLKQMSGSRDQFNGDRRSHHSGRTLVEFADLRIPLTDDEECRRSHPVERVAGQIGPTAP